MPLDIVGAGSDASYRRPAALVFPAASRPTEDITPAEWMRDNRALLLRCARAAGIQREIPAGAPAQAYVSQVYDGGAADATHDYLEAGLQIGDLRIPLGQLVGEIGQPKIFEPDRRFLSKGVSPAELAGLAVSFAPLLRPDRVAKLRARVAGHLGGLPLHS